jgi:hypothetical protein
MRNVGTKLEGRKEAATHFYVWICMPFNDIVSSTEFIYCSYKWTLFWAGDELSPLVLRSFLDQFYQIWMIHDDCGAIGEIYDWQGKPKYSEKTCSNAALVTRDPT